MPESQSVKERLIFYLEAKHLTKSAFGSSIGASSSFVDSIRSSIQPERLERIMDTYPDLDIVWLLTGRGAMEKQETTEPTAVPATATPFDVHHNGVVNINTLNDKMDSILQELDEMKEERKRLLTIIENLSRQ